MSTEETKRKYLLASLHKRSLLKALESDDSPNKPTGTATSSSPYKIQLRRAKNRSFTKRNRNSVTPKRRKTRKSKSSDRSQESPLELQIIDRTRRTIETSDSEDNVLLFQSPRKVRRPHIRISSPKTESPIFVPRIRQGSKRNVKSSEEQSADDLLRDVPPEYLSQLAAANSDADTVVLHAGKVHQTSAITNSPTTDSPIFKRRIKKGTKRNVKTSEGRSADGLLRDVPAGDLSQIGTTISDADTVEIHPRKDCDQKTYKGRGSFELKDEPKTQMNIGTSDLLWEEFVKKNYDKIVRYLKPKDSHDDEKPFKRMTLSPATNNATRRNAEKRNDGDSQGVRREASFSKEKPRSKGVRRPKTTKATQGRGKRKVAPNQSGNWMGSADEYLNPLLEDVQFEKGGQNGGRMTFSEFMKARNAEKARLSKNSEPTEDLTMVPLKADENRKKLVQATSRASFERLKKFASDSDSEDLQATRRTIGESGVHRVKEVALPTDTDSNLARKKRILDISNRPRPSTSGSIEIEAISPRELGRIHRMRKYAQRLKMNQSALSPKRAQVKTKQEKVVSRASTSQVDLTVGKKLDSGKMHSKMQSYKTERPKPSVKSVEVLTDIKLKRRHESWFLEEY